MPQPFFLRLLTPVHWSLSALGIFFLIIPLYCPWRRQWHPNPVLLPGKSHGWRNLVGCSPCGREESDTTEWICFHFSLSCIGEGNGNPLQCSCLENPRDGGAWWATVYGVAQSRTQLKWLSSSTSSSYTVLGNSVACISSPLLQHDPSSPHHGLVEQHILYNIACLLPDQTS